MKQLKLNNVPEHKFYYYNDNSDVNTIYAIKTYADSDTCPKLLPIKLEDINSGGNPRTRGTQDPNINNDEINPIDLIYIEKNVKKFIPEFIDCSVFDNNTELVNLHQRFYLDSLYRDGDLVTIEEGGKTTKKSDQKSSIEPTTPSNLLVNAHIMPNPYHTQSLNPAAENTYTDYLINYYLNSIVDEISKGKDYLTIYESLPIFLKNKVKNNDGLYTYDVEITGTNIDNIDEFLNNFKLIIDDENNPSIIVSNTMKNVLIEKLR
jgi:hypothetical protein